MRQALPRLLLKSLVSCVLFPLFSITLSSQVIAKKCELPLSQIDYKGPFATLFAKSNKSRSQLDCAYPSKDSPLNDETIYKGKITCRPGTLDFHTVGEINKINMEGETGSAETSLQDVSSFALGGDLLAKQDESTYLLTSYQKVVEGNKDYDFSSMVRESYADGVTTYEGFLDWAIPRGLVVDGPNGPHVNPSIYSAAQLQTPLREQLLALIKTAELTLACAEPSFADANRCSTFYVTQKTGEETAKSIAEMVVKEIRKDDPVGSWSRLPLKKQWQAVSLHLSRSSLMFILFLPVREVCTGNAFECFVTSFFNFFKMGSTRPQPRFIKALIPESMNTKEGVNGEFDRFNPGKKGTNAIAFSSPSPSLTAAADQVSDAQDVAKGSTLLALADDGNGNNSTIPKAEDYNLENNPLLKKLVVQALAIDAPCAQAPPAKEDTENLGATSDSRPADETETDRPLKELFNFNVFEKRENAENRMELYHVYLFSPPDVVETDDRLSKNENSILRQMFPLKDPYTGARYVGFDKQLGIPQDFNSKADNQTHPYEETVGYNYITKSDGTVEKVPIIKKHYVSYGKNIPDMNHPGRFADEAKWIKFTFTYGLKDINHIGDQSKCLVEEHLQPGAETAGFDLISSTKADQFPQSNCPSPIKPGVSTEMQCIAPEDLAVKPGCELTCDTVNGYAIPPTLKKVIEGAASTFGIPPGLLLGAMYAEGGFEPRCSGSDNAYSDEEIQAMMQCDITSCCNNNSGPFSLISGYAKNTIYQAKKRAGIAVDKDNPGNACNIADSALAIADVLSRQRGYDKEFWFKTAQSVWLQIPSWQTDGAIELKDSCGGIEYTNESTNSCTGWSDNQAVTAIRLQQGFCGNGNLAMDTHRKQMLDVFHQCSK